MTIASPTKLVPDVLSWLHQLWPRSQASKHRSMERSQVSKVICTLRMLRRLISEYLAKCSILTKVMTSSYMKKASIYSHLTPYMPFLFGCFY